MTTDPLAWIYGASIGPRGGALVGALHGADDVLVANFTTFPSTLRAIGDALQGLPDDSTIFVDGGLHGADLWHYLDPGKRDKRWRLFEAARPELRRAELVGRLRAAHEQRSFHVVRGLPQEEALRTALASATREDAHERVEVAALSLAVVDRRPPPRPPLFVGMASTNQPPASAGHLPPGLHKL